MGHPAVTSDGKNASKPSDMINNEEFAQIDRILKGEQSLYAGLVDQYKRYVFTLVYRILQHRAEAEEASQDVFVKAFQNLKNFNRQSKFSTWLYRIAVNTAITYKRRHKMIFTSLENSAAQINDRGSGILEKEDKRKYLDLALEKLNEADRAAVTLFYMDEFSLEEMAGIMNMAPNTIKVRIHRARQRMAEALKQMLKEEAITL